MLGDIPLLAILKQKLSWTSARQNVLAQNVSNAQTPGYEAHDLKPFTFQEALSKSAGSAHHLATTHSQHLDRGRMTLGEHTRDPEKHIWETTPDGNSVVLEQQMFKMASNQMEFQSAVNLYKKSITLLKIAVSRNK